MRTLFAAAAVAALLALPPSVAPAATLYWSGTGTWDTTSQVWGTTTGGPYTTATWDNATPDSAIFEGTAGTVTLGEAITFGGMIFDTAGYTIANGGNTLTFPSGTITANADVTIGDITKQNNIVLDGAGNGTIASITDGNKHGDVRKNGTGTWTVQGELRFGHGYLNDGDLVLNGGAWSNYRNLFLNGGTLHYNNEGALRFVGSRYLQMGGGSVDNTSGAAITTSLHNPGQLWNADFTFIGSNGADSDLNIGTGAVTLNNNRNVTVENAATTLTVGGVISDGGSSYGLTKAGDGTLELTGDNTYTGATTVNAGTLSITKAYLADTSYLSVDSGAMMDLDFTGTDDVFFLTLGGSPADPGTWGAPDTVGVTHTSDLLSGTGILNNVGGLAPAGTWYWDGGTTDIGTNGDGASDGGDGTWSTSVANWDRGVTTHKVWNNTTADKAVFSGTSGEVTLDSDITLGEMVFDSAATGAGYVITGNNLNFGGAAKITVESAATIESGITGSPTVTRNGGNLTLAPTSASMTLGTISNSSGAITLGGSTTGNSVASMPKVQLCTVNKDGNSTWTVGDVYGGYIHIKKGTLIANGKLWTDYRYIALYDGATLCYNNPAAVQDRTSSGGQDDFWINGGSLDNTSGAAIAESTTNPEQQWRGDFTFVGSNGADSDLYIGNGRVLLDGGDRQVTVEHPETTFTVGGEILDNGSAYGLIKAGPGTLELTGACTYDGNTAVNEGTLEIGGDGSLGGGDYAAAISIAAGATFRYNSSAAQTLGGAISGDGSLAKQGAGTLTLIGDNSYAGDTIVGDGTLSIINSYLADEGDVYVSTGALLELDFSDVDIVDELFVDGFQQGPGTYGRIGLAGAGYNVDWITGEGMLRVVGGMLPMTWIGGAGDDWDAGGNWDPAGPPQASYAATVDTEGAEVTVGALATAGALEIKQGAVNVQASLEVDSSVSVGAGGRLNVDGTLTADIATISGGTLNVNAGGAMSLREMTVSGGTITLAEDVQATNVAFTGGVLDTGDKAIVLSGTLTTPDAVVTSEASFQVMGSGQPGEITVGMTEDDKTTTVTAAAGPGGTLNAPDVSFQGSPGLSGTLKFDPGEAKLGDLTVVDDGWVLLKGAPDVSFRNVGGLGGVECDESVVLSVRGAVRPGQGIGTLQVVGTLVFEAGAAFQPEVQGTGVSDLLYMDGTVDLTPGNDAIGPSWLPGSDASSMFGGEYVVADTGGIDGEFAVWGGGNIGAAYITAVACDVDLGGGAVGIAVTLHTQLAGDVDLDGEVARGDVLALRGGFGSPDADWFDGDLTFDGDVDYLDYIALKRSMGDSVPATGGGITPEPATLALLAIGALAGLRRRRRR